MTFDRLVSTIVKFIIEIKRHFRIKMKNGFASTSINYMIG